MKRLSQAALDVLSDDVAIDGLGLRITRKLDDRKLYVEVDSALRALGGKWTRGAQAHLFAEDPADALDQVLVDGGFHDVKRDLDQFFTPDVLAADVVAKASIRKAHRVLEPNAGAGALVRAILAWRPTEVVCVERDLKLAKGLLQQKNVTVKACDFLSLTKKDLGTFDVVAMNPPFSRQRDIVHVTHAFGLLKPKGMLVAIMAAGLATRSNKAAVDFKALVNASQGSIEPLPDKAFAESGTNVRTVLVTMRRP